MDLSRVQRTLLNRLSGNGVRQCSPLLCIVFSTDSAFNQNNYYDELRGKRTTNAT